MTKLLIVEDDLKTSNLVAMYAEREGHTVMQVHDGLQALSATRSFKPDVIVLDLMLPQIDGLDICRIVRGESEAGIIMLTARSTETDKLLGLDTGADDYLTKPFSPRELMARIRALLRRMEERQDEAATRLVGDLSIDLQRHRVIRGNELVDLTPREFALLEVLSRHPGQVYSRDQLMDLAFDDMYERAPRTVDVHVLNLRRKLERDPSDPEYVLTIYGVGYKLNDELDA